jgi:hypothetical protein
MPYRGLSGQGSAGLLGLGKPLEYQLKIQVGQFTIGLPLQAGAAKAIELGTYQAVWPGLLLDCLLGWVGHGAGDIRFIYSQRLAPAPDAPIRGGFAPFLHPFPVRAAAFAGQSGQNV